MGEEHWATCYVLKDLELQLQIWKALTTHESLN